jgi:hypothetical protein
MANLLHAMNHHAKDKVEIINTIGLVFTTSLSQHDWVCVSARGGAGSYLFANTVTGKQQHFRDGGKGCINVYSHWLYKSLGLKPDAILRTRLDVYRWAKKLTK